MAYSFCLCICLFFFFFFSSRRRHTRWTGDWSSDVCSSDLIRQAAQGEVLHNDDTSMRVLRLAREPSDDRTGVFTSGIVSTQEGRRIALYFTGRQHAGENLRDVLEHRTTGLARPLQMCDALSRNTPKLT